MNQYRIIWWDAHLRDYQVTGAMGLAQAKEAIPIIQVAQGTNKVELVKVVEEFWFPNKKSETLNPIQSPAQ